MQSSLSSTFQSTAASHNSSNKNSCLAPWYYSVTALFKFWFVTHQASNILLFLKLYGNIPVYM